MTIDIAAPMPGMIKKIIVKIGDGVKEGEELVILESMKMEIPIVAPSNGTVKEIKLKEGDAVNTNQVLVVLA
jgi:biotin carboxyl carrier protein